MTGKRAGFGKKDRLISENSALTNAGTIRLPRRADHETTYTESRSNLQSQGGYGRPTGRPHPIGVGSAVRCPSHRAIYIQRKVSQQHLLPNGTSVSCRWQWPVRQVRKLDHG